MRLRGCSSALTIGPPVYPGARSSGNSGVGSMKNLFLVRSSRSIDSVAQLTLLDNLLTSNVLFNIPRRCGN